MCLMRLPAILFGLVVSIAFPQSSSALTRIENDVGGSVGKYLLMFAAIRDAGEHVMIDGHCFSACTLVTALIPRERVCITERAMLGFHASWTEDKRGQRLVSTEATELLFQMYPPGIRSWITRHGGLGPRTIILTGRELAAFYRYCR
jgi:hypothetical protein